MGKREWGSEPASSNGDWPECASGPTIGPHVTTRLVNTTRLAWTLAARPTGRAVLRSDFALVEQSVPDLEPGEFRVETAYLSVAPVMRNYMLDGAGVEAPLALGDTMRGRGVGRVVASRNGKFPEGAAVQGALGWQTSAVLSGADGERATLVREFPGVPLSAALGALGMTGLTAWVGLYDIGALRDGETVFVSAATGGVGSLVVPLAKRRGAHVVGTCSTPEKAALLTGTLGADAAILYRDQDVEESLARTCPDGVDVVFDNVGGAVLDAALPHLRRYGRVVVCGRISQYLVASEDAYRLRNWHRIGQTRSRMEGFFVYDHAARLPEAQEAMADWIADGSLPLLEDVLDGIQRMPDALIRLYEGKNRGKQLVRVGAKNPERPFSTER